MTWSYLISLYAGPVSFDVPLRSSFTPNLFERFPAASPNPARQVRNRAHRRSQRRERRRYKTILRFEG